MGLDRVQVVKGWRDATGALHERVFDVAASNGREVGAAFEAPSLASVVDGEDVASGPVGAAQLQAFWQDPAFDPAQPAFYYVRVIEVPKPRWPAYDAARLGAPIEPGTRMLTRDRAYTSPIWYQP